MVYLSLKVGVRSSQNHPQLMLIFRVAQNSERILIYICVELVLGITVSMCRWTPTGGVDERTFVATEREESLGHSRAVTLFCFLGVNWRLSA